MPLASSVCMQRWWRCFCAVHGTRKAKREASTINHILNLCQLYQIKPHCMLRRCSFCCRTSNGVSANLMHDAFILPFIHSFAWLQYRLFRGCSGANYEAACTCAYYSYTPSLPNYCAITHPHCLLNTIASSTFSHTKLRYSCPW